MRALRLINRGFRRAPQELKGQIIFKDALGVETWGDAMNLEAGGAIGDELKGFTTIREGERLLVVQAKDLTFAPVIGRQATWEGKVWAVKESMPLLPSLADRGAYLVKLGR
jgi:hypothetical protein